MKVTWDENTCSHAGKCVQGSPEVFKVVDGNFVINESAASEQEVRATVASCPSGALKIEDQQYQIRPTMIPCWANFINNREQDFRGKL